MRTRKKKIKQKRRNMEGYNGPDDIPQQGHRAHLEHNGPDDIPQQGHRVHLEHNVTSKSQARTFASQLFRVLPALLEGLQMAGVSAAPSCGLSARLPKAARTRRREGS
jgi:hypothetical protein